MQDFINIGVSKELATILSNNGIVKPTPIQEKAIPEILEGKDVIAMAQTGTGKTFAFALPMIERINTDVGYIQALVITPTRELAIQITAEIKKLTTKSSSINLLAIYGGQDVQEQLRKLDGKIAIVVATPGRLLDHLRRGTINLAKVSFFVIDEADQMLHIGFLSDIEQIIQQITSERQTLLFSATMPKEIRQLATQYMTDSIFINIEKGVATAKDIEQFVVETTDRTKLRTLSRLINELYPTLAIIFCRTKRRVSKLNESLKTNGYLSDELHGGLSQTKREDVLERFRHGRLHLLIATDVAARGIDVEGVTHVFNYDIPHDVDSYIHRIGRTGRAGEQGLAITLVAPKDRQHLNVIENGLGYMINKMSMN